MNNKISTAQKVRLWFACGCQAMAILLSIIVVSSFNYSSFLNITAGGGDLLVPLAWGFVFEVAAATLASISLYRFLHPLQPHTGTFSPADSKVGFDSAAAPPYVPQPAPAPQDDPPTVGFGRPPTQPEPPGPFQTQGYERLYRDDRR